MPILEIVLWIVGLGTANNNEKQFSRFSSCRPVKSWISRICIDKKHGLTERQQIYGERRLSDTAFLIENNNNLYGVLKSGEEAFHF